MEKTSSIVRRSHSLWSGNLHGAFFYFSCLTDPDMLDGLFLLVYFRGYADLKLDWRYCRHGSPEVEEPQCGRRRGIDVDGSKEKSAERWAPSSLVVLSPAFEKPSTHQVYRCRLSVFRGQINDSKPAQYPYVCDVAEVRLPSVDSCVVLAKLLIWQEKSSHNDIWPWWSTKLLDIQMNRFKKTWHGPKTRLQYSETRWPQLADVIVRFVLVAHHSKVSRTSCSYGLWYKDENRYHVS